MRFYLANVGQQDAAFNCRIPEIPRVISQPIRVGNQVIVAGKDLNRPQIDSLINQVETFGGRRVGDTGETKSVIKFLYDVDKEVSRVEMLRVMRHNQGQLTLVGKKAREEAAIAVNAALENMTPGAIAELEMTIQEETPPAPGEKAVAEGIIVRDPERETRRSKSERRRRR